METNNAFGKLVWSEKAVVVILNPNEGAKTLSFAGNDACDMGNALTAQWRGQYKLQVPGKLYLHAASWAEADAAIKNDNEGYIFGAHLSELVEKGEVSYAGDILPKELYRLALDGMGRHGEFVYYRPWVAGQPESNKTKWNRSARTMISNLEILNKCLAQGVNIQLNWGPMSELYFLGDNGLRQKHDAFLAGDMELLASMVQEGIDKKIEFRKSAAVANALEHLGETPLKLRTSVTWKLTDVDGREIDSVTLIGREIMAHVNGQTFSKVLTVTPENIESVVEFLRRQGGQVVLAENVLNASEE